MSTRVFVYVDVRPDIYNFAGVTPDGKLVAYTVGNIWGAQPPDGSKGHWLTEFAADQISTFQFSPDGKSLAVARSHVVSDVVLLHETGASR